MGDSQVKALARTCWSKIERLLYYHTPGPDEATCTFLMSAIQGTIEEALAESKGTSGEESEVSHERVARDMSGYALAGLGSTERFTEILRREYGELQVMVANRDLALRMHSNNIVSLKAKLEKALKGLEDLAESLRELRCELTVRGQEPESPHEKAVFDLVSKDIRRVDSILKEVKDG